MRKSLAQIALLLGIVSHASDAQVIPVTSPERFLEVESAAAPARELLFLLEYALHPVCAERTNFWSAGAGPIYIFPSRPGATSMQRESELLQKKFGVKPGQRIFLHDQPATSYGVAGIRAGDVIDTERNRAEPDEAQAEAAMPKSEAAKREGSLTDRVDAIVRAAAEAQERIYSVDPIRRFTVIRNGAEVPIAARMVRICRIFLMPLDSKYRYAESNDGIIMLTVPLLQGLSREALVTVLAHEAAQVALGLSKNRTTGGTAARFLFGKLANIGENVETRTHAPKDADLIQADRLAMRIATGLGVEPAAYLGALTKLVAATEEWGRPDYPRTRPLSAARLSAIERSVQHWEEKRRYYPPRGVPVENVRVAYARATAAWRNPAVVFSTNAPLAKEGASPPAGPESEATPAPSTEDTPQK